VRCATRFLQRAVASGTEEEIVAAAQTFVAVERRPKQRTGDAVAVPIGMIESAIGRWRPSR